MTPMENSSMPLTKPEVPTEEEIQEYLEENLEIWVEEVPPWVTLQMRS